LRISLVGPIYPFRGGIAQHTALLARALQQAGHRVDVISFKRQYPAWLYPGQSDREPDEAADPFPASYLLDPLQPWTWWQAARQVAASKPDLALVVWWTTFWSPAYASLVFLLKRAGVRVAYLIHNVLPHEQRFYDRFLARLSLRKGQGFIVQMEAERRRLLELLPKAGPIVISPHPLYDQFLEYRLPKAEARQRLGLPEGEPVVLFFGIVRPYKGLRYLVEALGILDKEDVKTRLVVAGEFWEEIELYQQLLARFCILDQTLLVNHYLTSAEVGLYFSAADLFAAPYTGGTQSGAVKIALAFGLPVVMTDRLVDEWMAERPESLLAVPPGDARALAQAIRELIGRGEGARQGQNGPSQTGWDKTVRNIEWIAAPSPSAPQKVTAA
jgi:D-inositol-3-phosphate glycosyltransferase